MLLQYIHIISILMMPSILWSAPVPTAAMHPRNIMLPPLCFMVGMVLFGLQVSPFYLPNIMMVIMAKQFYFCFIRPEDQKVRSLSPCAVANRSLFFYRGFEAVASSLLSGLSGCRYRPRFTVDIDTFVPVSSSIFTRCFAVVLGLFCTFRTKVQ